jgi:hypothetical protein
MKLKIVNLPWGAELEKDSIQGIFQLAQRDIDAFQVFQMNATIDLNVVRKGETKYLTPHIEELPPWVKLVQIDSVKVRRY